jgi:cytochrome c biogenesis factor
MLLKRSCLQGQPATLDAEVFHIGCLIVVGFLFFILFAPFWSGLS